MFQELEKLIRNANHPTALTGAGVSTLSGIPDFRGKNGVYAKPWHGMEVETILSIDCFMEKPELFYEWARTFVYCVENYEPSIVHKALAKLERQGMLRSLFTQNIDQLHTKAGSKNVYEVHGSAATHHCLKCGAEYSYAEISPEVLGGKVPRCRKCGGLVKPDIVFYGEELNQTVLNKAVEEMKESDLLLVLGTSLTVYPVASLPELTLSAGGRIVIVNATPTPMDRYAAARFDDLQAVSEFLIRLA